MDLCLVLKQFFSPDLKCHSSAESFSSPPILSERFSSAAQYQYFYPLSRLLHFQTTLAKLVCGTGSLKSSCVSEAAALSYASYLDIDFDVISHAVTLSGFWREGLSADMAKSVPTKGSPNDSLEVGVLVAEKSDEPEELKLGGYLTVIGEDDEPSKLDRFHAHQSTSLKMIILPTLARSDSLLLPFPPPSSLGFVLVV